MKRKNAAIPLDTVHGRGKKKGGGKFKGQYDRAGQEVTSEQEPWWLERRHVVRTPRSAPPWAGSIAPTCGTTTDVPPL